MSTRTATSGSPEETGGCRDIEPTTASATRASYRSKGCLCLPNGGLSVARIFYELVGAFTRFPLYSSRLFFLPPPPCLSLFLSHQLSFSLCPYHILSSPPLCFFPSLPTPIPPSRPRATPPTCFRRANNHSGRGGLFLHMRPGSSFPVNEGVRVA